jgi:hypothetical protein
MSSGPATQRARVKSAQRPSREPKGGPLLGLRSDPREPKARGAAWTDERGTSEEGRKRLKSAPEASGKAERGYHAPFGIKGICLLAKMQARLE